MFICPDLRCVCLEDSCEGKCIAFRRGIKFITPNIDVLRKICGDDTKIDLNLVSFPLILDIDVGVCEKYNKIITDSALMKIIEENVSNESIFDLNETMEIED